MNLPDDQLIPRIGIITALPEEYAAMKAMLDNGRPYHISGKGAGREYWLGDLNSTRGGKHSLVLTLADMGTNIAGIRATKLLQYFPNVDSIIMVGIAGGIPNIDKPEDHVRLGDIVVSNHQGVIQYDFDKETIEQTIFRNPPRPPDPTLLEAIKLLAAEEIEGNFPWLEFIKKGIKKLKSKRPLTKTDNTMKHPKDRLRKRGQPRIFISPIACANKLLKNPEKRDNLRDRFGAKAVEMETSGIADATWDHGVGYLAVRGICDYCDENKNDIWHIYASIVAASYVGALISSMQGSLSKDVLQEEKPAKTSPEQQKIFLSKLPSTTSDIFGREQETALLDSAWADPHTHILSLVAWGGVGKTSLVNHWLNKIEKDNYRGAVRVYGWSFYSQGAAEGKQASADEFLAHALEWFGDEDPTKGSPWDKGVRLAELIRKERTLFILDGLEPLQYPPGEMHGELRDPGVKSLLKELSRSNNGLCVISTRINVKDLDHALNSTLKRIHLENLSHEAGARLLEKLGVKGTDAELQKVVEEFKGHALAITLLGRYLAVVHEGEIRKKDLIPKLTEEEKQGGHARRVMESYEQWLNGKPELNILYLMGLFDRPADGGAIEKLRDGSVIEGLTNELQNLTDAKWKFALKNLRDLRLLAEKDENRPDSLDCHPLTQEHFGEKLEKNNPKAWKEAHSRLYEYYKKLPEKELPDTLDEMQPLFAAVAHGCLAGKHQETKDNVYEKRIKRDGRISYTCKKLGAFGSDMSALSGFFEIPWTKPVVGLGDTTKADVLDWAGFNLRALGRLQEAIQPMKAGLKSRLDKKDLENSAIAAGNISELYLTLGDVKEAVNYAQQAVKFADQDKDKYIRVAMRTTLADAMHQAGETSEAEKLFQKAERMQKKRKPEFPYLDSVWGFRFCDLLLSKGEYNEVIKRAEKSLEMSLKESQLLSIGLDKLSLGQAYLLQAKTEETNNFSKAIEFLDQAVGGLREAGSQDHLPRGFLARAELYRVMKDYKKAWAGLNEAKEIAERGGMKLFLADYHLEASRLLIAEDNKPEAKDHLTIAKQMINEMGYHRRDKEIEAVEKKLTIIN